MHKHQCHGCGTVWEHSDSFRGNEEAHLCPHCGEEYSFWHYHGHVKPKYVQHQGDAEARPVRRKPVIEVLAIRNN